MAVAKQEPTREWLKRSPIDFLYVFASDDFLKLVSHYISASAARTIREKRAYQIKYLTIIYEGKDKVNYSEVKSLIESQYGITPAQILSKLLAGETVAGKNWKEGVYGIGATSYMDGFASDPNLKVDTATGSLTNKSTGQTYTGVATYDKNGNITAYTYSVDGGVYTTAYDKKSGNFYANTYGTANNMFYADNTPYTPVTAASVWENINTAMPMVENFMTWLGTFAQSFNVTTVASPSKTVPTQKELSTIYMPSTSDDTMTMVLVAGAALIGGMLLLGGSRRNNR